MAGSLRRLAVVAVALAAAVPAWSGPAKRRLELADLAADPPLEGRAATGFAWVPGSARLSFLVQPGSGSEKELVVLDAENGARSTLVGSAGLGGGKATLDGYQWSPDGGALLLAGGGELWLYRVSAKAVEPLTQAEGDEEFPSFSPDGRRVAFVRKNDLHVVDVATRQETRLTRDGGELIFNGRLDWVYEEELASRSGKAYVWSPDSAALAYLRLDDTPVPAYPMVDFLAMPRAVAKPQRYPQPGDANPVPSLHVVGADGTERARVAFEAKDDLYVVPRLSWTRDARKLAYMVMNRAQDQLDVKLLDTSSGVSAPLLQERDERWLNVSNFAAGGDGVEFPHFLPDGRFLWLSERTGFKHAYLGRVGGSGLSALTRGEWQVDRVAGVDEKRGWLHFASTEGDPRERRLARARFDGTRLERVSSEPGVHRGELSPDGRFVFDTHSSLTAPPKTVVRDVTGGRSRLVDQPEGRLDQVELPKIELVNIASADGTQLHGRLIKPPDFDPARRYPVIVHVYGGPSVQMVQNAWLKPSAWTVLASRGYLIWSLDNRGSWGRGHAFETPIFRDMGRLELADQLEGVRYLKSLPYVDPARIGITGWSYGGYMTLYAMTKAPEVWKCGAAGAPVVDWRLYDSVYTERYMRRPGDNPDGYRSSSPLEAAASLKGKLLLLHGAVDDNVHMHNTLRFVEALIKAGVPYELLLAPGQKHGFGSGPASKARDRAFVEFFEKNL